MKKITKIISLILVAFMLVPCVSCKKRDIDVSLNSITEQSEYSNTEYMFYSPDWEYVGDYYYKKNDTGEFDSYHQMYRCRDNKKIYFLVGEYLGWNKTLGGITRIDCYSKASEFLTTLIDSALPYFFNKKEHEWRVGGWSYGKCENIPDEYLAARYTGNIMSDKDLNDVAYINGACLTAGESPVNFTFIDFSKEQYYQDKLEQAVTNVLMSFEYGELVISEDKVKIIDIDVGLTQTIEQSKYSNTEYTVNIPDWKYVGDYYSESENEQYDSYHRTYQCKDNGDVYLFVSEYLGWNKIPGKHTPKDYVEACENFAETLLKVCFDETFYFSKRSDWIIGQASWKKCENISDEDRAGRYTGIVVGKDFENENYEDGFVYFKGVCFIAGESQVNFGFLDLSKGHLYQDELDQAVTDVSMSFAYGKLVIQEEEDPFAN